RRKSTLLVGAGALVLLVLCLQYNALGLQQQQPMQAAIQSNAIDALDKQDKQDRSRSDGGVKFVKSVESPVIVPAVVEDRDRGDSAVAAVAARVYVPPQRMAHFDLKGAAPRVPYIKKVFALMKQLGATGVVLEWEDAFPFWGPLESLATSNAYSRADVRDILQSAKENGLEVMPLVQTFGHVEFALKHAKYASIREVPDSPQALCPSNNASMDFIKVMIDQVMELHPGVRYLHIGCDEVFQMGECPRCRNTMRENLFLGHVARVARYVRSKYSYRGHPVTPIIWHDMLQHLAPQSMDEYHLGDLVEPMIWVYAEDVYRFVPTIIWDKFASVFPRAWTASAFKGAFGETMYIPNIKRHLENNLKWLEVMTSEGPKFKEGFQGIVITGWQRYDHFAVLCELLPAAIPSLAVNMLTVTNGFINPSLKGKLTTALGCAHSSGEGQNLGGSDSGVETNAMFLNLNSDPFLWDMFNRCSFPGVSFFRLTYRLHNAQREVRDYLHSVTKAKGWMTDYNVRHNFTSPLRIDELMMEQPRVYHSLVQLAHNANDALRDVFDAHTIAEWVEQRIYPDIKRLEQLAKDAAALKARKVWPRRPLPALADLGRLGISLPEEENVGSATDHPRPS
ncbi:hexosaminidase D-like, partial [Thrips palmi]|uniref:beta-N-acetylhexosaminidase n=1 Tax=Thrips palmi TaxID=161013 RepID=A0A6P8Y3M2_THRPL